jgi:hypothetical protein
MAWEDVYSLPIGDHWVGFGPDKDTITGPATRFTVTNHNASVTLTDVEIWIGGDEAVAAGVLVRRSETDIAGPGEVIQYTVIQPWNDHDRCVVYSVDGKRYRTQLYKRPRT